MILKIEVNEVHFAILESMQKTLEGGGDNMNKMCRELKQHLKNDEKSCVEMAELGYIMVGQHPEVGVYPAPTPIGGFIVVRAREQKPNYDIT